LGRYPTRLHLADNRTSSQMMGHSAEVSSIRWDPTHSEHLASCSAATGSSKSQVKIASSGGCRTGKVLIVPVEGVSQMPTRAYTSGKLSCQLIVVQSCSSICSSIWSLTSQPTRIQGYPPYASPSPPAPAIAPTPRVFPADHPPSRNSCSKQRESRPQRLRLRARTFG